MKIGIMALVAGMACAGSASADLVAYWNYNASTAGVSGGLGTLDQSYPFQANAGAGQITTNFTINTVAGTTAQNTGDLGTFGGDLGNALFGDPAGGALAMRAGSGVSGSPITNNGKYVQFELNLGGYASDVVLSYATRNTATGFQTQTWSYSTDGVTFTNFQVVSGLTTTFAVKTVDFGAANLGGAASAIFRVTFDGATNTGGNNRMDNVQFNATAVPVPGTLALVGVGALAVARRRR